MPSSRFAVHGLLAAACAIGLVYAASTASRADSGAAGLSANNAVHDYSSWAVDPATAGPDLPPTGRSLFDFLVTDTGNGASTYRVPFPFPALVEKIRTHSSNREFMGGIGIAIIPMGRSLQRAAAAPEFFRYPRTVIAVTGEPRTDARDAGMLLKDRLYIGYVEKTATLEVISYNEAAGRFEFQLVKDYRAGARPRVFYADRAICISCHQNHAPIFSRPVWGETNANARVVDLLRESGTDMDLSTQANIDFPDHIDKATMRANDLVTFQALWQRGCADEHDPLRSRRCRAAAFAAVLQYGLSGSLDFDANAPRFQNDFVATFTRVWARTWPEGLRVAQSSLPDRNPLGAASPYAGAGSGSSTFDWIAAANVPPHLDPLTPRPPREILRFSGAMDTPRIISGWANFLAVDDFRTLDSLLVRSEADAGVQRSVYRAQCTARRASSNSRFNLQCTGDPGAERSMSLVAQVEENGSGRIDWLSFGPAGTVRDVNLDVGPAQRSNTESMLRAAPKTAALSTRLPDGRRLAGVTIRWSGKDRQDSASGTIDAQLEAILVNDFALVHRAIDRVLEHQPALLDNVPLMRAKLMPALLAELGAPGESMSRTFRCCVDDTGMPAPTLDAPEIDAVVVAEERLRPFFRYCATCHFTAERFPPNFLSGKADQVTENLRRCAPRMLVRLTAWEIPPDHRAKTPMPPVTAMRALGTSADQWAVSKELEAMRDYVEELAREAGQATETSAGAYQNYEALPSCLPSDS